MNTTFKTILWYKYPATARYGMTYSHNYVTLTLQFFTGNAVKRGICYCYNNICLSVRPSVCARMVLFYFHSE